MKKTLRIYAREKTITMKGTGEQRNICEYSYTKDGSQWFQVKFKKECTMQPKTTGYYLIDVVKEKLSVQHLKPQEKFTPNPVLWIGEVLSFKRDEEYEKEIEAKRLEEIDALFNDDEE